MNPRTQLSGPEILSFSTLLCRAKLPFSKLSGLLRECVDGLQCGTWLSGSPERLTEVSSRAELQAHSQSSTSLGQRPEHTQGRSKAGALSPPLRNVSRVLCASTLTLTLLEMRWLVAHHQFFCFPTHRMLLRQSFHPNSPNPVFTVILLSDKVLSLLMGRSVSNLPRFYYRSKRSSYLN